MRALERFKEKKNKDVEILRLEPEEMRRIPKIKKGLGRCYCMYFRKCNSK